LNGTTSLYFGGVAGDSAYDHTVIEQRLWGSAESSELLLFKGNDISGPSGPDRIRLRAAEIHFDTYSATTTDRTSENIRMRILGDGKVGIGASPSSKLHIEDSVASNEVACYIKNGNSSGYPILRLGNDSGSDGVIFKNGSARTGDGGANAMTVRNDAGDLRLQSTGGGGITITATNGNVGIGVTPNAYSKLSVQGRANIHAGTPYAVPNNLMAAGSLTIGDTTISYGGGNATAWASGGNPAGLMLECADNTEIAVHDAGNVLASFFYYRGGYSNNSSNLLTIGRDMGWGNTPVNISRYLGIGTTPSYPLHITNGVTENFSNASGIYSQINLETSSGGKFRFGMNNNVNANLYFMANTGGSFNVFDVCGVIENDTAGVRLMNFTGQHRCTFDTSIDPVQSVGLIACASGSLWSLTENLDNTSQVDHITINESLPEVILSSKAYSTTIFGIVSDTEDTNNTRKSQNAGRFVSIYQNPFGEKQRIFLNSLGEGGIWVCNENGPLQNGDLITTSNVPGYGMSQGTGTIMNYTVGKITIDCDFTAPPLPIMCTKKKTITKQVPIYITETTVESTKEIVYDEVQQRYIQKTVSKTTTKEVQQFVEVELYDENGVVVGKHRAPQFKTEEVEVEDKDENGNIQQFQKVDSNGVPLTKPAYQLRYLLPNGTIITKEEYLEKIAQNQPAWIAAFVSCTYKTN
jgi:hypothetical protein